MSFWDKVLGKPTRALLSWVDSGCRDFNNLVLSGNSITAKSAANVFGKNKVMGQYTFTATFSKIDSAVWLGVVDTLNKNDQKNNNFVFYRNDSYYYVGNFGSPKGNGF